MGNRWGLRGGERGLGRGPMALQRPALARRGGPPCAPFPKPAAQCAPPRRFQSSTEPSITLGPSGTLLVGWLHPPYCGATAARSVSPASRAWGGRRLSLLRPGSLGLPTPPCTVTAHGEAGPGDLAEARVARAFCAPARPGALSRVPCSPPAGRSSRQCPARTSSGCPWSASWPAYVLAFPRAV